MSLAAYLRPAILSPASSLCLARRGMFRVLGFARGRGSEGMDLPYIGFISASVRVKKGGRHSVYRERRLNESKYRRLRPQRGPHSVAQLDHWA